MDKFGISIIILGIIVCVMLILALWRLFSYRYSLPCPTWLSWMVEMDNPFSKIHRATTIAQNLDLQAGMTVVDIGCGPGRVTIPVAHKVGPNGKVVAMDIQEGMLRKAQEKAHLDNLTNIEFLHAKIGDDKLGLDKFDRALLVAVFGEIPNQNRETALKEIFNALKPGGILSVTEIIFDPHFHSRSTILQLANAVGFREKKQFGNSIAYTLNLEKPQ